MSESLEIDDMGTKSIALALTGVFLLSSAGYCWDNPRSANPAPGAATSQPIGQPHSYSSPGPPSLSRVPNASQRIIPNNDAMPSDAPGWPMYPYPDYHNPFYNGTSPRDLVSGTVDWIVGLPSTMMDSLSNLLDRKVFPQAPATHGANSPNSNAVKPLYVKPETPVTLPPATPYIKDDAKGR